MRKIIPTLQKFFWIIFLVSLPVTNFPFFPPAIGGEALVRPLSLYPLIILIFLAIIPSLIKRPIPRTILSLIPFVIIAIISSLLSLLRGLEPVLGISVTIRTLRGVFTLAIGCAIYLAVALLPRTKEDLRFTLRWIYTGGALALLWGSLQAVYIVHFNQEWFSFLTGIQRYISSRRIFAERISGLTYEPNWFAEQIILLLLPWLVASVLWDYSVFRRNKRWRRLTPEWMLLIWAILLLPFTYSRAGVLDLVILLPLSLLIVRPTAKERLAKPPKKLPLKTIAPKKRQTNGITRVLIQVVFVILILAIPIYLIGTQNPFFARIWEYWQRPEAELLDYIKYLGFDARLAYIQAAYFTYQDHPLLGVGLGNYAFYFEDMLPDQPIAYIPEVLNVITPKMGRDRLITSKNFYLRLLAETGGTGMIAFITFLIATLGSAIYLRLSPKPEHKFWGSASLCGLIAFTLSALTFDSFVIPNMWVVFGLITAATHIFTNRQENLLPGTISD